MSAEHETLHERLLFYPCLLPVAAYFPDDVRMGRVVLPPVSPTELQLVPGLDGATTYADLIDRNPAYENLSSFMDHLVWWDRPLEKRRLAPRGGDLVISAHPDDVEFSMGGWLIRQRNRREITHAICFSQLSDTRLPEAFLSPCEVTAVRRSESTMTARMLGLCNVEFNLPDFGLRNRDQPPDQFEPRERAAARLLGIELCRLIERTAPHTIFAPAAIGNHPDHRIVFDAMLEIFEADRFPGTTIHFYEDVPYSAQYRHIDSFLSRFETSYIAVRPWVEDISDALALKLTLCDVYRSQAWPNQRELLEAIAVRTAEFAEPRDQSGGAITAAERFWTLGESVLLGD
jgi:LmbE family N-acetylglucosaminyl deacetylase